ncbi:beta-N-acetylhexosaminidase [Alkalihalobacterium bogoriense]|uniref:beta-N-acetylhexosaminidase n=1 Tax=Alkalihalobacterium bogoriense TaxID=246272 RepID=UPI00047D6B73|nr:beta-N-acetylhexosaminidase [Alkalihalobacterium bogoriense]
MNLRKTMSLDEKIGQMFMFGFDGLTPNEQIMDLIETDKIGGVCYFKRNTNNPEQVFRLSKALQEKSDIPLFLTIDQEGGMVTRLTKGVTISPGNMALGAANDPDGVKQLCEVVGNQLKQIGINMNFAPCIDVNNNPDNPVIGVRSYGEDPDHVALLGTKAVEGYQAANVSAVPKHFPGHGDTAVDSHLGLPIVEKSYEQLKELELVPFKEAVATGVDSIMVSHVCFPAVEDIPSTLSKKMVTHVLREEMKYTGVIVTDCMEMKAVLDTYGVEESTIRAVEAGIDLVLFSHTYEFQKRAKHALVEAVHSGRISEKRIDESVKRILSLKQKRLFNEPTSYSEEQLQQAGNQALSMRLSEKSITVVKDENHLLPLKRNDKTLVLLPEIKATSVADEIYDNQMTLQPYLSSLTNIEEIQYSTMNEDILRQKCKDADQIVLVTYNASSSQAQKEFLQSLVKGNEQKTIVCAMRNPYDYLCFPTISTYICTYEIETGAKTALCKVLTGEVAASGTLPVSIPGYFAVGHSV